MTSGVISVETEIVAQVNDTARWLDVMGIDKLTGYAVSQAKENYVRVVQLLAETQIGFTYQVPVYGRYGRTFGRGGRCCHNLYIRMVQQNSEQFTAGVACAARYRYAYFIRFVHKIKENYMLQAQYTA